MSVERVGDLTLDQLREIIRREIEQVTHQTIDSSDDDLFYSDLADFPIDDLGPWPENLTFRREDMYDDDGR